MNMTHYMELLATNQPWNLLLFMGVPVVLAETLAITELYLLYNRNFTGRVRQVNRLAGITVGIYFIGIILYLIPNAVIPITQNGEWRTALDVFAVGTYLLSGIPLILVALQDLGLIQKKLSETRKLGWHITYVAAFLVLGHLAMIAGMADPSILGYQGPGGHDMEYMDMGTMPSHNMAH
ncbi:MAG: hypothetical protein LBQ75_02905 [Zoogloeaceae bacterium]|jgi:hypothetical protein|nr:hypothetical protein [Zoogloeaceae bacterium]